MTDIDHNGRVYTFYSYKGGVGRSMALANVACLMAKEQKKVLIVDWDLEAPGLEMFFKRSAAGLDDSRKDKPGVVDLLTACSQRRKLDWRSCLLTASVFGRELSILSAGRETEDYHKAVQSLDWKTMFSTYGVGNYINELREEWKHHFDFVLIDSRTGITDIGDICTVLLPDALVLLGISNHQNIFGLRDMMERARKAHEKLPRDRDRLVAVPVLCRDDLSEYEQSEEWKNRFANELGEFYRQWLPYSTEASDDNDPVLEALNKLFIPYVPYWNYGERLPVVENPKEINKPTSISAAYKRLARLLMSELDWEAAGLSDPHAPTPGIETRPTIMQLPEKFLVAFSFAGEQRDFVRAIAEMVEKELGTGNVYFDEWFEHYIAGADADLKLQAIYSKQRSELVVVCLSEHYADKPWTHAEHQAIRARLITSRASEDAGARADILPIRFGDGEVPGIHFNAIVPDVRERTANETAKLIIDRLGLIVPGLNIGTGASLAGLSWPETPAPVHWPVAGHSDVREAFARLLTRDAPWRFLPLLGPTETGKKSHITRQMLANALQIPELACGRFDFKGAVDLESEFHVFVQSLDVPLPPERLRLNGRLQHTLDGLKRRARPALLIFDTYEAVGEAQEWVERQLLPSLIRAAWLRVVIAGEVVPQSAGAIWDSVSRTPLELAPPSPAEWFEYGKQYRPDLTREFVETASRLTSDKASVLAALLGPRG